MSGQSKHTTLYSASDIQRYLKGELSAREMHQLEKTALEDPFLADALEGLEKQAPASQDADLDDLRTRLGTRVAEPVKRRALFFRSPWLRAAAALILLIGLGFTVRYTFLNGSSKLNVTQDEQVAHPAAPVAAEPAVPAQASQDQGNASASKETDKAADSTSVAARLTAPTRQPILANTRPGSTTAKAAPPIVRSEETIALSEDAKDRSKEKKIIPDLTFDTASLQSTAVNNGPPVSRSRSFGSGAIGSAPKDLQATVILRPDTTALKLEKKADGFYYNNFRSPIVVTGKVLDIHNNPLPGASLRLAGNTNIGTITDQQGLFSLKVPKDSILRLTVGMVGYQPTDLAFNTFDNSPTTGNVIHLQQQNNALDEVVVVGYGSKRKEFRAFAPSSNAERVDYLWQKAQPVVGKLAYLDYLEAGKKTIGVDSTIKGTVIISFDVNKKGALTAFKVEQSLTPAHDAGIIRLVSEGSAWKVTKGRSVRAAVRVVF